ncbi:unnamed protein product [Haemonchus placei]|uniref:DDE_Tnp_1_7 domain-containing protein n=1 Tax=Haemonchus placei TaxID=6290 RepID=A0A0N4X4M3_HAEPC|nr:unnamed protein product [Haemonchus placei]
MGKDDSYIFALLGPYMVTPEPYPWLHLTWEKLVQRTFAEDCIKWRDGRGPEVELITDGSSLSDVDSSKQISYPFENMRKYKQPGIPEPYRFRISVFNGQQS